MVKEILGGDSAGVSVEECSVSGSSDCYGTGRRTVICLCW